MSFDQVGELTVPRYRAIYRHFARHPPVQWMIQSMLGFEGEKAADEGDYIDIDDLELPGGVLSLGGFG